MVLDTRNKPTSDYPKWGEPSSDVVKTSITFNENVEPRLGEQETSRDEWSHLGRYSEEPCLHKTIFFHAKVLTSIPGSTRLVIKVALPSIKNLVYNRNCDKTWF